MRYKVSLSLLLIVLAIIAFTRYFSATDRATPQNDPQTAVIVEALQETKVNTEPAATAPAAVIAAINSLLLENSEDPTLVMLYVNGDNDLADYLPDLVSNIHSGAVNQNVITYQVLDWPGKDNSHLYRVDRRGVTNCDFKADYKCGGRYIDGQNVSNFPEDMGDPANLSKFISETVSAVPYAKNVVLSLVGHGGGWSPNLQAGQPLGHGGKPGNGNEELGGLLWDNYTADGKPGNSLSTIDLRNALQNAHAATNRKIDLLYLDACLMGMWEVAHEVKGDVNFLLASESWSWTSFAYDKHLGGIGELDTAAIIGAQWIVNEAAILRNDKYPFTYLLLDLAKLPDLTTSLDSLASQLTTGLPTNKEKIRNAFAASACFDSNADGVIKLSNPITTTDIDNYCDLDSFAAQLKLKFTGNGEIANTVQVIQSALSKIVVAQNFACGVPTGYSTQEWCWSKLGGISLYTPFGQDDWKHGAYSQLQVATATHWDEMIKAYWNAADAPAVPECPVQGCPLPEGPLAVEHFVFLPVVTR